MIAGKPDGRGPRVQRTKRPSRRLSLGDSWHAVDGLDIDLLSHELLTGLTVVVGMAHLLDDTALDDQQRRFLDAIRRAADTLPGQARQALNLARRGFPTNERLCAGPTLSDR